MSNHRLNIDPQFLTFINQEVLPQTALTPTTFWPDFETLIEEFSVKNRELLHVRDQFQTQLDQWHKNNRGDAFDFSEYKVVALAEGKSVTLAAQEFTRMAQGDAVLTEDEFFLANALAGQTQSR